MNTHNLVGMNIGQYYLRELIGVGGMSTVYRAYQHALNREVAIKLLGPELAQQPGYDARFAQEAQTAAKLEHVHIVPVYDYGSENGHVYIVMRLLTGGTLRERLEHRAQKNMPLPSLGEVSDFLQKIASALDYAHERGIIHRDIKPTNIMFDHRSTPFLVDFGISRVLGTTGLTGTDSVVGTPTYMAPEQWQGEELTPATDQYALGILTYSMLTGHVPFDGTPPHIMYQHLNEMPMPLHLEQAGLPDTLTLILERSVAKRPTDRFETVTAFAQAFHRAIAGHDSKPTQLFTFRMQPRGLTTVRDNQSPNAALPSPPSRKSSLINVSYG